MKNGCLVIPFPDSSTHVCGGCFVYNQTLHFLCGYNFPDIMARKFNVKSSKTNDKLQGQLTKVHFKNEPKFEVKDLPFSRLIAPTVVYSPEFQSSYIFGGIFEEVGQNADFQSVFVSSRLYVHKWFQESVFLLPWTILQPKDRLFHAACWDSDRLCMWIFGGGSIQEPITLFNDLWSWSSVNHQWSPIPTVDGPNPRWGCSLSYCKNKLYLLGGLTMQYHHLSKSLYILDLTQKPELKWVRISIPENLYDHILGISMTKFNIPGVGEKFIIAGGSNDRIYKAIGFSISLSIEQLPENLDTLSIWSFDPDSLQFDELDLPEKIDNVSFHSATSSDNQLYLVGGLNHCPKGRSFGRNIVVLDIPSLYVASNEKFFPIGRTFSFHPSTDITQHLFQSFFDSFEKEVNIWSQNSQISSLINLFFSHQKNPHPLQDFYLIKSTFISKELFSEKIGRFSPQFCQICEPFDQDFGLFLYSGTIASELQSFSFKSFIDFILIAQFHNLYRLILLEISLHLRDFSSLEILQLTSSETYLTKTILMDDPQLQILQYVFRKVVKEKRNVFFNKGFNVNNYSPTNCSFTCIFIR